MANRREIERFVAETYRFPHLPRIYCFGDSWFQYPGAPRDLHKQLRRRHRRKAIYFNNSVAGRESAQIKGLIPELRSQLGAWEFDALLVSMGGNDVVGGELREFVKTGTEPQSAGLHDFGALPAPVADHIRLSAFARALAYLWDDFVRIVQARADVAPRCELFVHTYDYPWPDGRGFRWGPIRMDAWLEPYFEAVGLTRRADQRTVCVWLVDQFAALLIRLASTYPRIRVVDTRGTIKTAAGWENEIHPTAAGFAKLVRTAWVPALESVVFG